jgi:gluconate 2-dehydrogenase gamma chain
MVAGYGLPSAAWALVRREIAQGQWQARFFTEAELAAYRVLADLIIPRDERSGSATEAGVVEYVDFLLSESGERTRQQWRDGLRWLDGECWQRFGKRAFTECEVAERTAILDDIAGPTGTRSELRHATEWFSRVRETTGSAFFSSRMGVEDVGYIGGVFNPVWNGAPPEALRELGVSYAEWDRRYGRGGRR